MKLDPNMEINGLLKRAARRGGASSLASMMGNEGDGAGGSSAEQHLDADELSAYAENALPAAARARYSSHLADCDSCRKQVTELVLALGIAGELEREAAAAPPPRVVTVLPASKLSPERSWRMRLAGLFAPAQLRFAAMLIVVVGVVAVAFMVFREGRPMKFDEQTSGTSNAPANRYYEQQNQNQQTGTASPIGAQPAPAPTVKRTDEEIRSDETHPNGQAVPPQLAPAPDAPKTENAPAPVTTGPSSTTVLDGAEATEREAARDEDSMVGGNKKQTEPAAPRTEKDKNQQESKTLGASSGVADLSRTQAGRDMNTTDNEVAQKSAQPGASEAQAGARKRSASGRARPAQKESGAAGEASDDRIMKDDRADTLQERRNVSGRQFVKRGGAWVDTAYRSQATTNVRRGSDQYRALVADEPGLRNIAQELGGEVIIVWKGKAYRIRN